MNRLQNRRRIIGTAICAVLGSLAAFRVRAQGRLDALSNTDATAGLRAALEQGAQAAIGRLGRPDGFLKDAALRIPLPPSLQKIETALRFAGMQAQADQLVVSMNRAAESAVPLAKPLMQNAIRGMSVADAKKILSGGDTSVTEFFKAKTASPLTEKFIPIVKRETDKVGLAQQYNGLASQAAAFGLVSEADANIERYVTRRALDGLYTVVGEEERAIRQDPLKYGGSILSKVFGALR
ncbi:MAG TPA: DUF4197 domain-containing protein [Burkholderiaceae bacterium]|nr:DUF4197 domain-containing protein [Burkholderiaceae bacterium]